MAKARAVCLITDRRVVAIRLVRRNRSWDPVGCALREHGQSGVPVGNLDPAAMAEAVAESLTQVDAAGDTVDLVIPLNWCFTHVLERPTKHAGSEALGYVLEEFLPVPVDSITATYVPVRHESVLAVGVFTAPVSTMLDALASKGHPVHGVFADALLGAVDASRSRISCSCVVADDLWMRAVCLAEDGTVETLLARHPGNLDREQMLRDLSESLTIDVPQGDGDIRILPVNGMENLPGECAATPALEHPLTELARTAAAAPAALNLRRGSLAADQASGGLAGRLRRCGAAAVILLVICSSGLFAKSRALKDELARVRAAQAGIYREAFDHSGPPPPGAALRMASERIRLEALRTNGSELDIASGPKNHDPLGALRDWVAGLPSDVRVMLTHARVDETSLQVRGRTRQHRDAERLTESLKRLPGLSTRPPRTARGADGAVEFTVSGQWKINE